MGEVQEVQFSIMDHGSQEVKTDLTELRISNKFSLSKFLQSKSFKWWILMAVYSFLILASQTAATILGKLYFDQGGNGKWMATLVQTAGFPVLIPFYFFLPSSSKISPTIGTGNGTYTLSVPILGLLYSGFGILIAVDCMLYSIGCLYMPVSTYSLLCASQLAFNALFSFFLNAQKFTPYVVNSLVLLTISSVLLVFQTDDTSGSSEVSKMKYAIGFLCTIGASAGCGLLFSLTQLTFNRVLKTNSFKIILDIIVYQSLAATLVIIIGLFASGEWKSIHTEYENYKLGKVSYIMTLSWTAISWELFSIGCVGLIVEVSSLFSNVISTLGLPLVPIVSVLVFGDKMNGIKVISMVLAIWGFVSYAYQHYLEDSKSKIVKSHVVNGNGRNLSIKEEP